jgi:GAF domain-containing protein
MTASEQFPAYAAAYAAAHASVRDPVRLAAVRATQLLDAEPEEAFDRLTRLAVRLVGVPGAFVSLVDVDRDFYLSVCGAGEALESRRELEGPTFCHFTVYRAEPLIIDDTAADPVYAQVPTVRSLGVAAYVGIPLIVDGQPVGAFCAIDTRPHRWTGSEIDVLRELAVSAQREVELRIARERAERMATRLDDHASALALQVEELMAQSEGAQVLNAQLEAMIERLRRGEGGVA